jgi:hypothetical protein
MKGRIENSPGWVGSRLQKAEPTRAEMRVDPVSPPMNDDMMMKPTERRQVLGVGRTTL